MAEVPVHGAVEIGTPDAIVDRNDLGPAFSTISAPGLYRRCLMIPDNDLLVFQGDSAAADADASLRIPQRTPVALDAYAGVAVRNAGSNNNGQCGFFFYGRSAAPAPPTQLTLTASRDAINVLWAPQGARPGVGDGPHGGWQVEYRAGSAAFRSAGVALDAADATAQISGLGSGTRYDVRVRATGPGGSSDWIEGSVETASSDTLARKAPAKKRAAKKRAARR